MIRRLCTTVAFLGLLLLTFCATPRTAIAPAVQFADTITQDVPDPDSDLYYENLRVLDPVPKTYFYWAKEVVRCLQEKEHTLRPISVKFFLADTLAADGMSLDGVYLPQRVIIIRDKMKYQAYIVKHEIVHAVCEGCEHNDMGYLPCTGRP